MDRQILIIDYDAALQLGRRKEKLIDVAWFAEVFEILLISAHLLLLSLVSRCEYSLISISKESLVGVYLFQYYVDVVLKSVRIDEKSAEWLQKLEHFLDAFTDYQSHLCSPSIVQAQQMSIATRPRHDISEPSVECIDQCVINVEDYIQTWRETLFNDITAGNGQLCLNT